MAFAKPILSGTGETVSSSEPCNKAVRPCSRVITTACQDDSFAGRMSVGKNEIATATTVTNLLIPNSSMALARF